MKPSKWDYADTFVTVQGFVVNFKDVRGLFYYFCFFSPQKSGKYIFSLSALTLPPDNIFVIVLVLLNSGQLLLPWGAVRIKFIDLMVRFIN